MSAFGGEKPSHLGAVAGSNQFRREGTARGKEWSQRYLQNITKLSLYGTIVASRPIDSCVVDVESLLSPSMCGSPGVNELVKH